jgi:hypothetical protein
MASFAPPSFRICSGLHDFGANAVAVSDGDRNGWHVIIAFLLVEKSTNISQNLRSGRSRLATVDRAPIDAGRRRRKLLARVNHGVSGWIKAFFTHRDTGGTDCKC